MTAPSESTPYVDPAYWLSVVRGGPRGFARAERLETQGRKIGMYRRGGQCVLEAGSSEKFARGSYRRADAAASNASTAGGSSNIATTEAEIPEHVVLGAPRGARYLTGLKSAAFRQTPSPLARSSHLLCLVLLS
jgi:hypothetical protein